MLTYTTHEVINDETVTVTYLAELQNGGLEVATFREVGDTKNPYPTENVPDYVLQEWGVNLGTIKEKLRNDISDDYVVGDEECK